MGSSHSTNGIGAEVILAINKRHRSLLPRYKCSKIEVLLHDDDTISRNVARSTKTR
jgi:hypothetical protein